MYSPQFYSILWYSRARGLELVSPEDILQACKVLKVCLGVLLQGLGVQLLGLEVQLQGLGVQLLGLEVQLQGLWVQLQG